MVEDKLLLEQITDYQIFLFNEGTNYKSYKMLGSIYISGDKSRHKPNGFRFAVWAPNAYNVCLVGDFNDWNVNANPMFRMGDSGVWVVFMPGFAEGEHYKYAITSRKGKITLKADPYAFKSQLRPDTASITCRLDKYKWKNVKALNSKKYAPYDKPMLIYEVHVGSWRRHEDGSFYSYRELAEELIPYVIEMGYTHIELMPLTEHPFDGSWGYQVTGYFSATSRYGSPEDLMYFIDECHSNGIKVVMDWVPAHFPKDEHGLARFDGTCLYEYSDTRIGEHPEWGTLVFNFKRNEVLSFLISSAVFWLDIFKFDGLRVDAVTSMLYRDYAKENSEWLRNEYGGRENIEAINFLQNLNKAVFAEFPNALMMAEESSSWPKVTGLVHEGGLGFNFKWNMGWMNDSLKYMSIVPTSRKENHNLLTFLMMYAFSENYILPISHDEVVHGKKSLLSKMIGNYEQKFASLRTYFAYMMALPGKKLMFMGCEFGQFIEWKYDAELDWLLLEYDSHKKLQTYTRELNLLYSSNKSLWQIDNTWDGFEWINEKDCCNSILSFLRRGKHKVEYIIVVCNFTTVHHENYVLGVPSRGVYNVILNSESIKFGGTCTQYLSYKADKIPANGKQYSILLDLPPLATIYLKKQKSELITVL